MTLFLTFWSSWAYLFRPIPNGDPYLAAFVLAILMVMSFKVLRSMSKYIVY